MNVRGFSGGYGRKRCCGRLRGVLTGPPELLEEVLEVFGSLARSAGDGKRFWSGSGSRAARVSSTNVKGSSLFSWSRAAWSLIQGKMSLGGFEKVSGVNDVVEVLRIERASM